MLRLLFDQHVSPTIGRAARKIAPRIECTHVQDRGWQAVPDPKLLLLAAGQQLTLVTFDLQTIPDHLREMHDGGLDHAGVIFVARATFAQNEIGAIGAGLAKLWLRERESDWTNRTLFLTRTG